MAEITKAKTPLDRVDEAELSAWKRMPATKALLEFISEQIADIKEQYWEHGNPANSDGIKAKGAVTAYEHVKSQVEAIK